MDKEATDDWNVLEYEIRMYTSTRSVIADRLDPATEVDLTIKNALVESAMLHTRVLVDILLSKGNMPDDLNLNHLLGNRSSPVLVAALDALRKDWGTRNKENSPCWTLNKILAHATRLRSSTYDYGRIANTIDSHIWHLVPLIAELAGKPHLAGYLS